MLIQYSYFNIRYSNINRENVPKLLYDFILAHFFFFLKSATTRLYDTEAKIICIVSKKGAQCIECHHKDI